MPVTPNENQKLNDLVQSTPTEEGRTRVVSGPAKRNAFIDTVTPDVLKMDKLADLVEALGEEMVVNKVQSQLIIDFRSQVRGKMESYDAENEVYRYDLDEVENADYTDWKPELRQRKTAEDKAKELFGKMNPDQIKAALAASGLDINNL